MGGVGLPKIPVLWLSRHVEHLEVDPRAGEGVLFVSDGRGYAAGSFVGVDYAGEDGWFACVVEADQEQSGCRIPHLNLELYNKRNYNIAMDFDD